MLAPGRRPDGPSVTGMPPTVNGSAFSEVVAAQDIVSTATTATDARASRPEEVRPRSSALRNRPLAEVEK
ncbi:hypothetical protein GCM10010409_21410 [Mycolicibacterium diernhoferi]